MVAVMVVLAQVVNVSPTSEGMPGAQLIQKLLGWTQMVWLWGSLAALLAGAAMYGLAREGGATRTPHEVRLSPSAVASERSSQGLHLPQ